MPGTGKQKAFLFPTWETEGGERQSWSSIQDPILSLARELPDVCPGLDEYEKAGLLTSRSFYLSRLTALARSGSKGLSSFVTAALPHGISTRFPILPQPQLQALFHIATTTCGGFFKELHF